MSRRQKDEQPGQEKIYGPYRYKRRYRLVLVGAGGARRYRPFASEAEARAYKKSFEEIIGGRTVSAAAEAWIASLAARGLKPRSIERSRYSLQQLVDLRANGERRLTWLPKAAKALYEACRQRFAGDTQLNALAAGKAWGAWCAEQGWLPASPFERIKGVGRKNRGASKPGLRVDEARALLTAALGERGDAGVAVAAALLFGIRATEVVARSIRDLDDGGKLLWLDSGAKTDASHRYLEVPEVLRPRLLELAGNRPREAPLWRTEDGRRPSRHWLHHHVDRLCRAAHVPELGPHGLRRTQARLATAAGATPQLVSAALGHETTAITALAYVDRSTARAADNRRAFQLLQGGMP